MRAAEASAVRSRAPSRRPWLGPGLLLGALTPLAVTSASAARGTLGADPVAVALNRFGLLALILLVATLAATPLRLVFGIAWPVQNRRLLGLLAFFYATLHVLVYALVDQQLALAAIFEDITERPFITLGFAAYVLLIPLAATSTRAMVRRLGSARWRRLHRLVYLAGLLACVHFYFRVKSDAFEPLAYAAVLIVLLTLRVPRPLLAALRRQR
jgi:methionine sulfoxide reductase heme-binding subunit